MKRDILGETIQRVNQTLGRVKTNMRDALPTGPSQAQMTPKEARLMIQNLDPVAKANLIRRVGPEEWDRMMDRIYG